MAVLVNIMINIHIYLSKIYALKMAMLVHTMINILNDSKMAILVHMMINTIDI